MTDLPPSWSKEEIAEAWQINPRRIDALVREGKVGCYPGKSGRRFFAEHLLQLRDQIEIRPQVRDEFTIPGQSRRSAARHRKSA